MMTFISPPSSFISFPLIGERKGFLYILVVHLRCHSGSLMREQRKIPENVTIVPVRRKDRQSMRSVFPVTM